MRDITAHHKTTHGMTRSPEYLTWVGMKQRCTNPEHVHYERYGGRGIEYDEKWDTFEGFFEDMGRRPLGMTLDREDGDGHYTKQNCRWASRRDQATNKSNVPIYTFAGLPLALCEWAELLGLSANTLRHRIEIHLWSVERALTTPLRKTA